MRKLKNKLTRIPAEIVRGQEGVSVLVVIFVMLVLSAVGYSMANMMAAKQKSVPVTAQSSSAFFMAESGINYAGKYLSDRGTWPPSGDTKNLGNGSFTMAFSNYCDTGTPCPEGGTLECVDVVSTGQYGAGERVLTSRFCRVWKSDPGCTL